MIDNPNLLYAHIFVNALAQGGLAAVCIAPGSRSTPLTLAFAAHPDIQVYLHLDERSAAFFALGMAQATAKPVALVCTSGTAAANFFPALIEANMSAIPLLLLTSDRPHELRHSGANQTIDQVKLYGDHVLWAVDMPIPQIDAPEVAWRSWHTLAARALAVADGLVKGPVHLNFPFRKPLEPVDGAWPSLIGEFPLPPVVINRGRVHPTPEQISQFATLIQQHPRGLIVCGPGCPGEPFPLAVRALAQAIGYPLLADPLSGLRFGVPESVGGYDGLLMKGKPDWPEPEVIIRFGQVPTSKWLNEYLDRINPTHRIHIRENGVWADDSQRTTWFWQAHEAAVCQAIAQLLGRVPVPETSLTLPVQAAERRYWQRVTTALGQTWFDGAAAAEVVAAMPEGGNLFIGNSLPVRHLDQFGRPTVRPFQVFGNRGASGIDGNVSTALGIAAAQPNIPLVAVLGDITFYHDLNGLLAVKQHQLNNVTFIVLNNNGGGIFRRLPIARLDPPFTELFLTPHGLTFAAAAEMYGLQYVGVRGREPFCTALHNSLGCGQPTLIELHTNSTDDLVQRGGIVSSF